MTTAQAITIHVKQYLLDFGVVLGLSFFSKFWYALTNEFSVVLIAHVFVLSVVAIFVRLVGRWIGEEIDSLSDVEFMEIFPCDRSVFELFKDPNTHGKMFRQNLSYRVYDNDKIKVESKFIGIKTTEVFQLIVNEDTVVLKNISGKYESSATYEYDGANIVGHFVSKPKGIRRVMALLFFRFAKKTIVEDITKFVNK